MPQYTWREPKRLANLAKHGLDFVDADMVLANPYRWEIAYAFEVLAVLTVVYAGDSQPQIISFRRARRDEREAYYAWLENDFNDTR